MVRTSSATPNIRLRVAKLSKTPKLDQHAQIHENLASPMTKKAPHLGDVRRHYEPRVALERMLSEQGVAGKLSE